MQIALETCAVDNNALYDTANCNTPTKLQGYEATIPIVSGNGNAWLQTVTTPITGGYTVTTHSTSGDTYSMIRSAIGTLTRTCAPASTGGCNTAGSW